MPRLTKPITRWFDYEDGRVEIAHLTDQDVAQISDEVMLTRDVMNANGLERERRINTLLDRKLTVRRAVRNWEGFVDADGTAMACTDANKDLWACDPAFMGFVRARLNELASEVAEQKKAATKN